MTAEIVVANRWGVAIAADSAVTIEQLYKGEIKEKVYNSANKLFTLSKWHPVGIMIYNTMTLGGTPWETIIKIIRGRLGRDKFDTLKDYADYFISELNRSAVLFPDESTSVIVKYNCYRIFREIANGCANYSDFSTSLDAKIDKLGKFEPIDGFDKAFISSITKKYANEIEAAADAALKSTHKNRCAKRLKKLIELALSRKNLLPGYSGIVVSGFGDAEVFPSVIEYQSDIIVNGRARIWQSRARSITQRENSFVMPFADTDVIKTITEGINPKFQEKFLSEAINMISKIPYEVLRPVTSLSDDEKLSFAKNATESLISAFSAFVSDMKKYRESEHVDPIEQTLSVLPVSELATVAETLLNASQIHKRVNPEIETVGGPVDVAVISKGDGFVWIKRKHYFDLQLNPSYTQKYLGSPEPT